MFSNTKKVNANLIALSKSGIRQSSRLKSPSKTTQPSNAGHLPTRSVNKKRMAKITSHDIQHKTEYRSLRKVRSSTNPSFLPTEATGQAVMYNYRDTDNELLSCVTSTLAKCRRKRNEWLDAEEGDTKKPFYLVTTLIEHYDSPPANNHSSSAFLQTLKNALVNYFIDSKQLSSLLLS